jgi:hypothetical protein
MKFRVLSPKEKWARRKKELEERNARLTKWHRIFALWPRRLSSDEHEIVWLQYIYRKGKSRSDGDGGRYYDFLYVETELDILKTDFDR